MFLATELTQPSILSSLRPPVQLACEFESRAPTRTTRLKSQNARTWRFLAIEKARRVRDADQNQWISMRPLFFALVFTLNSSIFAFPLHFLSLFRGIFLNLSLGVHFARRMKSSPPLMMRVLRWENFENILWGICEPVRLETCNAHRDIIYKSSNFIADRC